MVEEPRDLGAGEIGVEQEPCRSRTRGSCPAALIPRRCRPSAGTANDGARDGASGRALPHGRGLALVRDADRGDRVGRDPRGPERQRHSPPTRLPNLLDVVLDPAGLREVLVELERVPAERLAATDRTIAVVPVVPWSIARRCWDMNRRMHRQNRGGLQCRSASGTPLDAQAHITRFCETPSPRIAAHRRRLAPHGAPLSSATVAVPRALIANRPHCCALPWLGRRSDGRLANRFEFRRRRGATGSRTNRSTTRATSARRSASSWTTSRAPSSSATAGRLEHDLPRQRPAVSARRREHGALEPPSPRRAPASRSSWARRATR